MPDFCWLLSGDLGLELFWWDGEVGAWSSPTAVCGATPSNLDMAYNLFTGKICTAGRYGLFGRCSVTAVPPEVTAVNLQGDVHLSWDTDSYRTFEVWYSTQPDRNTARPLALNLTSDGFTHADGGEGSYYWVVGMNPCGSIAETAVVTPATQRLTFLPIIPK